MKSQFVQQGVLPGIVMTAPSGSARAEQQARPIPGVEFEELLHVGSSSPGLPKRWSAAFLAIMAGIVCLGFGGRWLGGPDSGRNADPFAVGAVRPTDNTDSAMGSTKPGLIDSTPASRAPSTGSDSPQVPARLPLGFAIAVSARPGARTARRIVVVGFVPRLETIRVRILDPDGSVLASAVVESRSANGAKVGDGLWAFEANLDFVLSDRTAGPDGPELEIRWTDDVDVAIGADTLSVIPL
jgi:hypothetical protein